MCHSELCMLHKACVNMIPVVIIISNEVLPCTDFMDIQSSFCNIRFSLQETNPGTRSKLAYIEQILN